ncbi:hypothetical protein J7T55_013975 [Diaporthe amygdali]|uniref:uncharacterized protein n=1 Tax=Phomopsis amygdali TaxID=1214568 RepID=UPI0022FDFFC0|nr:uncharacterized protein J7T55_013975 [Diaporthe amygdali]KAJ0119771.1 hypothetical protein J7T55_013975 [Diaporthe amygdali]
MAPLTQQRHAYSIQKRLDDNVYVVRHNSDNAQYLGSRWDASVVDPAFSDLLDRGTKGALGSLLNHPNLINYTETVADHLIHGRCSGETVSSQRMLLWDFCEAGTLQNLFNQHPVLPQTQTVTNQDWVAALDALDADDKDGRDAVNAQIPRTRQLALSWLHEGHRDDTRISVVGTQSRRVTDDWKSDEDWLPILHRDIRPDNIFFQHPKGTETYGLCKLGNYSNCVVSNHVNERYVGQVVSATRGDLSLNTMRANMAVADPLLLEADARPYTKATELFQLGRIVYEMMSTKKVPDPDARDDQGNPLPFCRQGDIEVLTGYSSGLRQTVRNLLASYRGPCTGSRELTSEVLIQARKAYLDWKSDTRDGKLHRDLVDDGWQRQANDDERIRADEELHARQGQLSSHRWIRDDLEPQPRVAVPPVTPSVAATPRMSSPRMSTPRMSTPRVS